MRSRGKYLHAAGCKKSINMLKTIRSLKKKMEGICGLKKRNKILLKLSKEKVQIHIWKVFTKLHT